ncbi:MAG TPA: 4-(cytidine 5'-diphospho)-2-C-methyl-D-erythritol kinase [Gemmatimonadaceae bacterium]|nr:4-(cytidine 5'-diphospho)-2-C-methyl-D-erythritol kinase [Gemmatimonadaceae bacterium]
MSDAHVVAQAKLNLGLRVLARETSGYHAIETIFVRLALGDRVSVRAGGRERLLICTGVDVGPVEDNLAYRAALAYAEETGWPDGFAIEIEKVIPVGGGLGGGSSDAGAVLRALDALAPSPCGEQALLRIAGTLGSDVPYLTTTTSLALAWGRGDQMLALSALPARHVVLVIPRFGVSTAEAYGWVAASRANTPPVPSLMHVSQLGGWDDIAPLAGNDFEPVVAERHPEIRTIIETLRRAGAQIAQMTGSGSTVYGIFTHAPDVAAIERAVPGRVVLTQTTELVEAARVQLEPSASGD